MCLFTYSSLYISSLLNVSLHNFVLSDVTRHLFEKAIISAGRTDTNSIISAVPTHKYSIISGRKIFVVFHFLFNGVVPCAACLIDRNSAI